MANEGALKKAELLKIVRDANADFAFLDDNTMPPFMRQAWADAKPDEDGLVRFDSFAEWYEGFVAFVDGEKEREEARERAKVEEKARGDWRVLCQSPPSALSGCQGDGTWCVDLKAVLDALPLAWAKGKTPLLIDATSDEGEQHSALETFLSYSGNALLELKKMVVEVNMKKTVSLEEAQQAARDKLTLVMKEGLCFVMLLSNSAPPLKSKFCSPTCLPYTLLEDNAAVQSCCGLEADWRSVGWTSKLLRPEDEIAFVHRAFNVMVVTKFSDRDYAGFLQSELPLDAMQHIKVTKES